MGALRTIVINDGAETYRAVYDDKTAPEADMRQWLLLSPYVMVEGDFDMAKSSSTDVDGREKVDKIFYATPVEKCDLPGCAVNPTIGDAWLRNGEKNLQLSRSRVAKLEKMKLPSALEPVRAYLLSKLRFTLDLEQRRFDYIRSGKVGPLQEGLSAACRSSDAGDSRLFEDLVSAALSERMEASYKWYNRLLDCDPEKDSYPIAAWQAFVKQYGVIETRIFNDPDSK
jgi:hypothetical protein